VNELRAEVDWNAAIPEERGVYIPILSPKVRTPKRALILSEKALRVPTHFVGRRTAPHLRDATKCEGCIGGLAIRWKAYLAGWSQEEGRLVLIEITHQAYCDNRALLEGEDVFLRGRQATLTRLGKNPKGPVQLTLDCPKIDATKLPPAFDVANALLRIWERRPDDLKIQRQLEQQAAGEPEEETAA